MSKTGGGRLFWRRVRKWARAGHKWAGILAAIPILILSVTGLLLVFEPELQAFEEREALIVRVPETARLPISTQLDLLSPSLGEAKVQVYIPPKALNHTALVGLTDDRYLFVNPYTGDITKETKIPAPIMAAIRVLHTSFFLGEFGTWIGIIASLAFCLLAATGCILFFKRRGNLRRRSQIELRKGPGRRNYDLHAVIGFYTSGLLSLIALSGALIGMNDYWRGFIMGVTDSEWTERPTLNEEENPGISVLAPENLLERVNAIAPEGLAPTSLILPVESTEPFTVRYTYSWASRPASYGYAHPKTGEILDFHHFPEFDSGHLIHRLNRGFHSGELFTPAMLWLWFVLMLIPPILILTSYFIWRSRTRKKPRFAEQEQIRVL